MGHISDWDGMPEFEHLLALDFLEPQESDGNPQEAEDGLPDPDSDSERLERACRALDEMEEEEEEPQEAPDEPIEEAPDMSDRNMPSHHPDSSSDTHRAASSGNLS